MNAFKTLLKREWMQHRLGWLVLWLAPPALALLLLTFGSVKFDLDDAAGSQIPDALAMATIGWAASIGAVLAVALIAAYLTAPGLARRDYQDRSIEFWLSLPQGHVPSLGATLLANLVLMPLVAVAVGAAVGPLVALLLVAKTHGAGALASIPVGTLAAAMLALALRMAVGVVLAALWMAPLVLLVMAAGAWLKRWGMPVVVIALAALGLWLDKLYQNPIVAESISGVLQHAGLSFIGASKEMRGLHISANEPADMVLSEMPRWALADAGQAVANMASVPFVIGALVAIGCFALMVLRRQRGA